MPKISLLPLAILILAAALTLSLTSLADGGEFESDRPGTTDNPKTAARGQYRIEAGVYDLTRNTRDAAPRTKQTFFRTYLVAGVAAHTEIQVAYDGYSQTSQTNASGGETLRIKQNLVSKKGLPFSLAILPRVQQTAGVDGSGWQGALALPMAYDITKDWNFSEMPEWDIETDAGGQRAHGFYNGIVLGRQMTDAFGAFVNNSLHTQSLAHDWQVVVGAGVTYMVSKQLQIDLTTDFGVTTAADHFRLQTGFTYAL